MNTLTGSAMAFDTAHRSRGRPKTRSDEEQMAIIVTKAMELYLASGFGATRMDDVAHACKVSKRTLYRLFPSKLDLFRAMVDRYRQGMVDFPGDLDALPMEEALVRIFHADHISAADARQASFLQRALADATSLPELGEILARDGSERAKSLLAEWFQRRKTRGDTTMADPYSAAAMMINMVFGAVALNSIDLSLSADADLSGYLIDCIRYFVNGVK